MEDNIEKKMVMFFEYGKRLKGQIQHMQTRERQAMADLAREEGESNNQSKQNLVSITGVNFKAVNNFFDSKGRTARATTGANSQRYQKKEAAGGPKTNNEDDEELMPWMQQKKKKQMPLSEANQFFTKRVVKRAEQADQANKEENEELFE